MSKITNQHEQNSCTCWKCKTSFVFLPEEAYWDDKGYGYSTKLVKCSQCGSTNIIRHVEDYGFAKMNVDRRLFK